MREQQTCPPTIHFNMRTVSSDVSSMWTVSSDVSICLRIALSPFVSLLYPPNPWCEWCEVWRLTTTSGSTSPTLFEQWCGFFYVPQEPDKCKCCETGPWVLVRPGFEPVTSRSADRRSARSPNWANQAAVVRIDMNFSLSCISSHKLDVIVYYSFFP